MEITVIAGLFTKRYVNVYTGQIVITNLNGKLPQLIKRFLQILVLSAVANQIAWSQKSLLLEISDNKEIKNFQLSIQYTDSANLIHQLNTNLLAAQGQGYLLAAYGKTEIVNDSTFKKTVYLGEPFSWAALGKGKLPEDILSQIGFKEKFYRGTVFKPSQVSTLYEKVLNFSQNNGYPFAWVSLDSIKISGPSIQAAVNFETGPLITFDSLIIDTNIEIKEKWLASYLGINPGEVFNQKKVDRVPEKIEQLRFVELASPPQIVFKNSKAEISLRLKKVKSNSIDGIIGFLPNEKADGSLLITGQLDLSLNNLFNSGKQLKVKWQSLKPRSQLLDISYKHRNFLRTPLDIKGEFYLLKEDSIFINRKGGVYLQYQTGNHTLSFFTSLESSRRLSSLNQEVSDNSEVLDFNINYYGVNYELVRVRNQYYIPRGLTFNTEVAIGDKQIKNLNALPQTLSDGTVQSSTQYKIEAKATWNQPVSKTVSFYTRVMGGKLINNQLFLNDLFRVGGLQSLRGFNENFFFASEYLVATAELRLYYEIDAYLYTFFDQSYIYYNLLRSNFEDYPLGVGVGINLNTKAGKLNLAFALGKSDEQSLSLSLSKFHFGYVAEF